MFCRAGGTDILHHPDRNWMFFKVLTALFNKITVQQADTFLCKVRKTSEKVSALLLIDLKRTEFTELGLMGDKLCCCSLAYKQIETFFVGLKYK